MKGKPVLKLIGNVEPIGSIPSSVGRKLIVKTKGIRIGDIVGSFLSYERVAEPQEFIKQICFESTAFLPGYYYMHTAGLNSDKTIEMLNEVVSRSTSKTKLIERIMNRSTQQLTLPTGDISTAKKKREYAKQLIGNSVDLTLLSEKNLEYCLQAIRGLSQKEISMHSKHLRNLLKIWFNKHYASAKGSLANNLRRSICWIDEAIYKEGVNQ